MKTRSRKKRTRRQSHSQTRRAQGTGWFALLSAIGSLLLILWQGISVYRSKQTSGHVDIQIGVIMFALAWLALAIWVAYEWWHR